MTASSPAFNSALLRSDTAHGWDAKRRTWTSAPLSPGFDADQVVASWNLTPASGALIEVSAADAHGMWGPWLALARWDALDGATRTSTAAGDGADATTGWDAEELDAGPATVETDVLTARPGQAITAARLRITLNEPANLSADNEALTLAALHFSAPDPAAAVAREATDPTTGVGQEETPLPGAADAANPITGARQEEALTGATTAVRPLSQRQHKPRTDLGGGGSVWCSPTSLAMVMDAWGVEVPAEMPRTDVPPTEGDPRVPWTAAHVFDPAFAGTGNWSFNAALAGHLGLDAVVTRLGSLADLGTLTCAGFPVICSVAFNQEDMPGADYSTAGHLLVALGLDADGNVRVSDPACTTPEEGLRTYPAGAFDAAWATSRRTVYLLGLRGAALPQASEGSRAW
ncbi:C39 family peptidase [Galactobacter valiniphilus]|nr:C39 family peptidase [Galactobacter valiniphilus]